jgi:hypothetical protein
LFHQDIGRMALMALHVQPTDTRIRTDIIRAIVLPIPVIFVAWLIYLCVERPLIRPLTALLVSPLGVRKSLPDAAPAALNDAANS